MWLPRRDLNSQPHAYKTCALTGLSYVAWMFPCIPYESDLMRSAWAQEGSNLRPSDYESPALTTELHALCASDGTRTRVNGSTSHHPCR